MVAFYKSLYDADLVVDQIDVRIVTQVPLTAPRTITLPHADASQLGQGGAGNDYIQRLEFFDILGTVGVSNTISFIPAENDRINGSTSPIVIDYANAYVRIYPLSGSEWTLVQQPFTPAISSTDYFATFENLTTGVAPVSIDPTVFLTRITSGGTAGTEIVSFNDYIPNQSGKPHLIIFETQTDPADIIQIYGNSGNNNPILISPFGPLANKLASGQFPAVFPNTTMELSTPSQGFVLTWTDNAWGLTGQVGEPTIIYPNAFKQQWDNAGAAPSVLTQLTDGTFALVPDSVSPFLTATITASSDISNPTIIVCGPRGVGIVSTGLGGPGYVRLFGPDSDNLGTTNLQRSIFFKTRVNPADTIHFTNVTGNIANSDGSNLTAVTFSFADDQLAIHWDNTWIVDPQTTSGICTPAILYSPPPIARVQANNTNATITIPAGYMILALAIENTNANAVTGGVKIGTSSGATDVVVAQAVGANAIIGVADATLLKKLFNMSASQNLFIQAVTSWNGAVVNFQFTYSRLS